MENTLTFASGRKIACDGALTGEQFNDFLHIHTGAVDFVEAARLFGDARETETLEFTGAAGVTVFRGYTTLLGIETDPLISRPGELLIRLRRPEEVQT